MHYFHQHCVPYHGIAMGSPLGPVLANLFMGYYEALWLNTLQECKVILYKQYIDIICLFNCEPGADKFFEFLKKLHTISIY